jgi:hypothetical protein
MAVAAQDSGQLQKPKDSVAPTQPLQKDSAGPDTSKKNMVPKRTVQRNSRRVDSLLRDSLKRDSIRLAMNKIAGRDSLMDTAKQDSALLHKQAIVAKKVVAKNKPVNLMPGSERVDAGTDLVFYILLSLLFFLGLIKTSFPKYINSIFSLSFQATFRQTQTREQMAQNVLPAFMMNVLFVFCGGLFITLFARFNNWTQLEFWQLFIYATAILLIIYLAKYIVISFTGWVFNEKTAAAEYRFIVFLINKLLGIALIPLLFLIAFSTDKIKGVSITIVLCLAVFCLVIRYFVSLSRISKNLSITPFHFFIYLCAVEIMPLLVIYKILFLQTSNR